MNRTAPVLGMLLLMTLPCLAAFTPPAHMENAPLEEQMKVQKWEGENSLKEQIVVGKARYEQRKAYRANVVAGMFERADSRQQLVESEIPVSNITRPRHSSTSFWIQIAIAGVAGICAMFIIQLRQGEPA